MRRPGLSWLGPRATESAFFQSAIANRQFWLDAFHAIKVESLLADQRRGSILDSSQE